MLSLVLWLYEGMAELQLAGINITLSVCDTYAKLLAGFNGNIYFINMHFTVKVWPWNAAKIEKWSFKRVRNIIKSHHRHYSILDAEPVSH